MGYPKVKYSKDERTRTEEEREMRGAFSERQGDERGDEGHTHSLVYWHISHTPNMYTNINIPMYTFTWDSQVTPQRLPHPGSVLGGGSQGAGMRRQEPGGGRGPAPLSSQHRQRVLSLLSGAGGQGPDPSDPSAAAPSPASPRTLLCLPFSSSLWLFPSPSPPSSPRVPASQSLCLCFSQRP